MISGVSILRLKSIANDSNFLYHGPMPAPTESPPKFRLLRLFDPAYLASRFKDIRSPVDLIRRIANIFVYVYYQGEHAYYELTGRFWPRTRDWTAEKARDVRTAMQQAWRRLRAIQRDRIFDARLTSARLAFAARRRVASRTMEQIPEPPSPIERNPLCRYEFSWNIHVACNYDCTYCWFHDHWDEFKANNIYRPAEEWTRHWARFNERYGPAKIDIAGGEPFTYPQFLEILEAIGKKNVIVISTNLSWGVERFLQRIDPDHVEIAASLHPEFVGSEQVFLEKLIKLRKAGFHANASLVAYPPFLPRLHDILEPFLSRGIFVDVQPFRGEFDGRLYPQSYTRGSERLVGDMIGGAYRKEFYPELELKPKTHRIETSPLVLEYQLGRKSTLGIPCNAGVFYGRIQSNGDVTRCAQGGYVGNFLSDDFTMGREAEPCPFKHCDCINEIVYIQDGPLGPVSQAVAKERR